MKNVSTWRISDFKSIESAELDFGPLTILAGANSAGKSSILQSLLMIAQTNQVSESIVLNGPLVRLGEPKDVVRSGREQINLDIGLKTSKKYSKSSLFEYESDSVHVTMSLEPDRGGKKLAVSYLKMTDGNGQVVLEATNKHISTDDAKTLKAQFFETASLLRVTTKDGGPSPSRSYVVLSGLTPIAISTHRNKREIADSLNSLVRENKNESMYDYMFSRTFADNMTSLIDRRGDAVSAVSETFTVPELESLTNAETALAALRSLDSRKRSIIAVALSSERIDNNFAVLRLDSLRLEYEDPFIWFAVRGDYAANSALADWHTATRFLSLFASCIQSISRRVQYLGPLREEPRVLNSTWDQRSSSLPVGIRGELSAEILTLRRNDTVEYQDWNGVSHQDKFPLAVGKWAQYLGIGDSVSVLDEGKRGRGMNLSINGVSRDLTAIGVGASQLLPVLVACLGVESGSLMIIEQPELHLHPAVQSRLADFFLFARPDIRVIVETHSEYIVTRIRRRVAEQRVQAKDSIFLFADYDAGVTTVRKLDMTEYGDFTEWPKGFFDEQDNENRTIIKAVSERLRMKKMS